MRANEQSLPWTNFWMALSISAIATGCGAADENGLLMGDVTGTVTYQGKPVPQANIVFLPQEKGTAPAAAVTDTGGRYKLRISGEKAGAIAGAYQVSIVLRAVYDGPVPEGMSAAYAKEEFQHKGKPLIPEKYFHPATSKLTADIQPGHNSVNFALQD